MDVLIKKYNATFHSIISLLQKRSKASYIAAIIFLIVLKKIYSFFRVPKYLRHLPCVSYFAMAKSFLKSEPPYSRLKRITRPAIEEGRGFYVVR